MTKDRICPQTPFRLRRSSPRKTSWIIDSGKKTQEYGCDKFYPMERHSALQSCLASAYLSHISRTRIRMSSVHSPHLPRNAQFEGIVVRRYPPSTDRIRVRWTFEVRCTTIRMFDRFERFRRPGSEALRMYSASGDDGITKLRRPALHQPRQRCMPPSSTCSARSWTGGRASFGEGRALGAAPWRRGRLGGPSRTPGAGCTSPPWNACEAASASGCGSTTCTTKACANSDRARSASAGSTRPKSTPTSTVAWHRLDPWPDAVEGSHRDYAGGSSSAPARTATSR